MSTHQRLHRGQGPDVSPRLWQVHGAWPKHGLQQTFVRFLYGSFQSASCCQVSNSDGSPDQLGTSCPGDDAAMAWMLPQELRYRAISSNGSEDAIKWGQSPTDGECTGPSNGPNTFVCYWLERRIPPCGPRLKPGHVMMNPCASCPIRVDMDLQTSHQASLF